MPWQAIAAGTDVAVQLAGKEAEVLARRGDKAGAREVLERARAWMDALPYPDSPGNHFNVDPTKFDKVIMRVTRLLGDYDLADLHAEQITRSGRRPDGSHFMPMRVADAKASMAVTAMERGDIDRAVQLGHEALDIPRQSLPSLHLVTSELVIPLPERHPNADGVPGLISASRKYEAQSATQFDEPHQTRVTSAARDIACTYRAIPSADKVSSLPGPRPGRRSPLGLGWVHDRYMGEFLVAEYAESEQGRIAYSVRGNGEPLIFLPGFLSSSVAWIMNGYPECFPGYRCVMIDPLGHGKSHLSHDPHDYTIDKTISQVLAVLDAENIESAPFVGFSRGGLIAAHLMERTPERMDAVVFGAAPLGATGVEVIGQLDIGLAPLLAGDWDAYWATFPIPLPKALQDQFAAVNDPKALGAVLQAMLEWPIEVPDAGVKPTGVPRLAYFGTGEAFADLLRSTLTEGNVDYVEKDWAGHAETMADAHGVSEIIARFLSSIRVTSTEQT